MSTVQHIYDRAAALPEAQQLEALDFIEFLATKHAPKRTESTRILPKKTAPQHGTAVKLFSRQS